MNDKINDKVLGRHHMSTTVAQDLTWLLDLAAYGVANIEDIRQFNDNSTRLQELVSRLGNDIIGDGIIDELCLLPVKYREMIAQQADGCSCLECGDKGSDCWECSMRANRKKLEREKVANE